MTTRKAYYSRGYIPHFDDGVSIQTIRFHIKGALPLHVFQGLSSKRKRLWKSEEILDRGSPATGTLSGAERAIVEDALLYFDGKRYRLLAWVIMPNHVHVCFQPHPEVALRSVLHTWKRYSSREINSLRGARGALWERDYFDRRIRNERHLRRTIHYFHGNPVKARLVAHPEEWRWSSAFGQRYQWFSQAWNTGNTRRRM